MLTIFNLIIHVKYVLYYIPNAKIIISNNTIYHIILVFTSLLINLLLVNLPVLHLIINN